MKVIFVAFSSGGVGQPSFPLSSSSVGEKPKHQTELAKMAFIGPETLRKQHRHEVCTIQWLMSVHQLTVLVPIQIWLPVGYWESGPSVNLLEFEIS